MELRKFSKPGKDIVIEIDEVEYLLTDEAVDAIEKGEKNIRLIQLYDRQEYVFAVRKIEDSAKENGVIDYLDKRPS